MRSLTEHQWDLYFELVERLEKLPPDGRQAALPALRAQIASKDVVSLLELHLGLTPELDRCRSGERIRNLVLAERIGCGGMGTVYRAKQAFAGGIEREVAVKLINPALIAHEPEHSQQRFQQEIGALVRLEHKGIARIYDGGLYRCPAHGDESLYFAMELVRGKPLTDYVAEQRAQLGTSGILRLFLRVCDAVAYAHRQGVVHRDLKPANILVDAGGEPRVIDFGLAEAFGAPVAGDRAGLICGTPAYMSPEQLGGDAVAPAPAADVYSLGVILHELLAGRRPGQVCSDEALPAKAGLALDSSVSASGCGTPDAVTQLRAACGSELASIVAKAMASKAGDRYRSVAALTGDLARCLDATEACQQIMLRTRRILMSKVREFWIDGVLAHSLHAAARIELGLALHHDAVEHPWDLIVQAPGRTPRAVPRGTPIAEVFDGSSAALLVLGAPGAGKTTLLLELANALLKRAKQDQAQRVPVVFHLSTWADQRPAIADWIVDELDKRYDIPPRTGRACLAVDQFILLLDGLDEVAAAHRAACVAALNALRKHCGSTPVVVCSRLADYEALSIRLRLGAAVVIQPLTRERIDEYLGRAGQPLAGVRAALSADEHLRELLTTPLLLSIAALAYQRHLPAHPATQAAGTPDERHAQLFAAYAEAMFTRRSPVTRYTPERSMRWLGWLASALLVHHQSVFYLEWMQPCWLPRAVERWTAGAGSVVLCGLLVGLVVGLGGSLVGDFAFSLPVSLLLGLACGLVFGRAGLGDRIRPVTRLRWSWSSLRREMVTKLVHAAAVGLLLGAGVSLVLDRAIGAVVGLAAALAFCYFGGLDLELTRSDAGRITAPNQGIRQSLRNALRAGVAGALTGTITGGFAGGLSGALFCAALFSLIITLIAGAHPCLQHLIVRLLLWRNGCAPWRYVRFLDFAVERVFVHRVGGGYTFVHRALLEYFAVWYSAASAADSQDGKTPR